MAKPRETEHGAAAPISFELERFEISDDRLELRGRWFGVRGRRFVRPTLTLQADGEERRALADLKHKPWSAKEGEDWLAAFPLEVDGASLAEAELAVAPDISIALPAPDSRGQHAGREPKMIPATGSEADAGADPRLDARAEVEQLRQALKRERGKVARLRAELEKAAKANVQGGAAIARRDAALSKLEEAETERERATLDRDRAIEERDRAVAEREALVAERDRAVSDQDRFVRAHKRLRAQRDEALAERDQALVRQEGARSDTAKQINELRAGLEQAKEQARRAQIETRQAQEEAQEEVRRAQAGARQTRDEAQSVQAGRARAVPPRRQAATGLADRRSPSPATVRPADWVRRLFAVGVLVAGVVVLVVVLQSA